MEGADILAKIISADGIIYVIDQNSEVTKDFENDDKHNIYFMKMMELLLTQMIILIIQEQVLIFINGNLLIK